MPPRMRTRSVGRPVVESRGRGTGERVGRGGRGRGPKGGNDEHVNELNEEFCCHHDIQKLETELWNHVMVGAGHAAYTDRFHELARLVPHLVTPESRKIERYIFGALTDEAVKKGSIKKVEKRGNVGEPSKDKNGRDDNKRTRAGNAFTTTANSVGRENTCTWPKVVPRNVNPVNVRNRKPSRRASHENGSTNHLKPACPRLNRAQGPRGNRPKQVVMNNGGQGYRTQGNQASGRAFMLGVEEARQHPNIMTGIEPSELVRIPLLDGKMLRVLGERPKEKVRLLKSAKASDKKQEEIVVFLGHVINGNGIHVDPSKIEAVKNWKAPRTPSKELAFQTLKDKLCNVPVLTLLDGPEDFVVYCDAFGLGLDCEAVEESTGLQKGLDVVIKQRIDGTLYYLDRIWMSLKGDEGIAMDFVTKLPRTSSGHDTIWVIVDRLTKSAYFLPMREDYKMDRLARMYLNEIVARHGLLISIRSYRDGRFTSSQSERIIQTLEDILGACVLDFKGSWDVHLSLVELSYNNSYHSGVRCALFEILYGRKCHLLYLWAEVREGQLIGPKCGMLWEERELALRFVGPFEIIKKIGLVAYMLDLLEELDGVHDTFHVSNIKTCLADPTLQVPLDEIQVDVKLNFVEELVEILENEFKKLKQSRITIVKVWWNSKRSPEFT
nr:hypothetical protein [Tanacetum cinerariifolium]